MSSIQERLHLKRVPLDTWNIQEQLCLASAVVRSGDQNWMSVSRALKTIGEPNRPPDWYSQKSCAAQYGALLEHVETPKRIKRSSDSARETPQESILKRLTQDRINEIQNSITEMNHQYQQLKTEITEVRNLATSEERLREIWAGIEASKRAQERENAKRAALLKEREERRARAARSRRGSVSNEPLSPSAAPAPAPPSSPLLTSLLKSSPVVTTPQHIPHPASIVDSISPSVTAPTLSMLLEKPSPQQDSKRAAIEHIKSQLVQIEQQLKANTAPASGALPPAGVPAVAPLPPAPAPAPLTPALDIDDIEINAEDVYVFRDVDIDMPAVHTQHAPQQDKASEKPIIMKKEEDENVEVEVEADAPAQPHFLAHEEEPVLVANAKEEVPVEVDDLEQSLVGESASYDGRTSEAGASCDYNTPLAEESTGVAEMEDQPPAEVENIKLSFPEVKFPTTEIKVVNPDEQKVKDEVKEAEIVEELKPEEEVPSDVAVEEDVPVLDSVEQQMSDIHAEALSPPQEPRAATPPRAPSPLPEPPAPLPPEPTPQMVEVIETGDIPLPPDPEPTNKVIEPPLPPEPLPPPPEPEVLPQPEVKADKPEAPTETSVVDETAQEYNVSEDLKRDEDAEDSIPLQQMIREECLRTVREDAHTETDDDTPMELSREEEKDGKKRRDYSRKKKPDSRTCSGSESAAEASAPESPHASDAERQHRLWKKSVMLVYSRLCAHKYSSVFLRPITDEEAPGYSYVVRRPMDLSTIRKNIENGVIRTTSEFQRDVLLMLSNALMYNSSEHSVYAMAKDMHEEAANQLSVLLAAQAHAALEDEPPARRKRRRPTDPRIQLAKRSH